MARFFRRPSFLPSADSRTWFYFRKLLRVQRAIVLSVGIYAGGKTMGQLELIEDPEAYCSSMLRAVLAETQCRYVLEFPEGLWLEGGTVGKTKANIRAGQRAMPPQVIDLAPLKEAGGRVKTIRMSEKEPMWDVALRTQRVFSRTKASALRMVDDEIAMKKRAVERIEKAAAKETTASAAGGKVVRAQRPSPIISGVDEEKPLAIRARSEALKDLDMQELKKARRMLRADWKLVINSTDVPNAFVHPMLPRRVFINVGLRHICKTDDEIAALLGHEMSHAILRHGQRRMTATTLATGNCLYIIFFILLYD